MPTLDDIKRPIEEHIRRYEEFVSRILQSDSEYVSNICAYMLSKRGKQMRPLLVLLTAALHGKITQDSYVGAAMIEMVHSASLMHDDVIDEADMRRGAPSINAIWKSHTAVIAGDFILARTFHGCMEHGNIEIIREVTRSVYEVSEGELIQTEQTESLSMTESIYYNIIEKKTAALLMACGAVGAMSGGGSAKQIENMRSFGKYLGMAFQIKDDILDYSPSDITGKPMCGDIKERKITLPLLYILDNSSTERRQELISKLENAATSTEDADYLYNAVINGGGMEYAATQMERLKNQALTYLSDYAPSKERKNLEQFAEYVLERKK